MGIRPPEFIKDKLPFGQFAAVVVTVAIGSHTIIERFSAPGPLEQLKALLETAKCHETVIVPGHAVTGHKDCLPPISFEKVEVGDGKPGGRAIIKTWFKRNRKGCPFVSWAPEIIASDYVQYKTKTTLSSGLTPPPTDGKDVLTDTYAVVIPENVPPGLSVYRASIDYSCSDSAKGKEIVHYPPDLKFCVLNPDGSRPKGCGPVQ